MGSPEPIGKASLTDILAREAGSYNINCGKFIEIPNIIHEGGFREVCLQNPLCVSIDLAQERHMVARPL